LPVAVVDASAVAAVVFGEGAADRVVERLGASQLAAPSLLPCEIVNVASSKVQRGELSSEAAETALRAFATLQIVLHEATLVDVFRFAVVARLTAYDAAYLWLARWLSSDLVIAASTDTCKRRAQVRRFSIAWYSSRHAGATERSSSR
jgi:predicted nucleic acid-binding protein